MEKCQALHCLMTLIQMSHMQDSNISSKIKTHTTHLAVLKDYWITHSVFRYFAKDEPTG